MAVRRLRGEKADCPLCTEATIIAEFTYWNIIANNFPYDKVAAVHHMLIPKRHITYEEITTEEQLELDRLTLRELNQDYNFMALALPKTQSIPDHLHYHLLVPKDV